MPLRFTGTLDRLALLRATDVLVGLVSASVVASAWNEESALPGMTVGGLTRHLVSQPECAVEFLGVQPVHEHAPTLSLAECYRLTDWFRAPVTAVENTSIRDDFNAMAAGGHEHSLAILAEGAYEPDRRARRVGADDLRALAGLRTDHGRLPRDPADGSCRAR